MSLFIPLTGKAACITPYILLLTEGNPNHPNFDKILILTLEALQAPDIGMTYEQAQGLMIHVTDVIENVTENWPGETISRKQLFETTMVKLKEDGSFS